MTEPDDFPERVVLGVLLERNPETLTLDELKTALSDVPNVERAVGRLAGDGLALLRTDRVKASRSAVRFAELGPI
jgi:hypothetical protein